MKMVVEYHGNIEVGLIKRDGKPDLFRIDMMGGSELANGSELSPGQYAKGVRLIGTRGFDGKIRETLIKAAL